MSLMRDKEGDPSVRFNGWEFEIDTPEMKLVCHALKGKPESLRKAA
jgi:hypothetical protein